MPVQTFEVVHRLEGIEVGIDGIADQDSHGGESLRAVWQARSVEQRFEFASPAWLFVPVFWLLPWRRIMVTPEVVKVRMAWGFRANIKRSAIKSVRREPRRTVSRGAHGLFGRWLVNTTGSGLITLELDPPQRGWTLGFPVRVRELTLSPADADGFLAEVGS